MGATRELAELVLSTGYDDLPDDVVLMAKRAIVDGIGNMLAGSREPLSRLLVDYLERIEGGGSFTVVGSSFRASPLCAAFANATFGHCLDYENTMHPPTHPISPTLAPSLVLGERHGLSGKEILLALVLGCEVQGRLRLAHPDSGIDQFHYPGTVGLLGATITAAKLLGLDSNGICRALGVAGSRAGGLFANNGTMTKSTHCGNAARMGLEAALMAKEGWTANEAILEAPGGFVSTVLRPQRFDFDTLFAEFGNPYRLVSPGLNFKIYPAQTPTHWSIEAALTLRNKHEINPRDVVAVEVRTGPDNLAIDRPNPNDGLDGKFSIHYTVAVALLDGVVNIDSFTDARRFSEDIDEMLAKIEIVEDPSIHSLNFLEAWSEVTVTLGSGARHSERCDSFRGHCRNPLAESELEEKFYDCARRAVDRDRARKLYAVASDLDEVEDVGAVVSLLRS